MGGERPIKQRCAHWLPAPGGESRQQLRLGGAERAFEIIGPKLENLSQRMEQMRHVMIKVSHCKFKMSF